MAMHLPNGDEWHDAKDLFASLEGLTIMPVRELHRLVAEYACTYVVRLPSTLPRIPNLFGMYGMSGAAGGSAPIGGTWADLAEHVPIGAVGLLPTFVRPPDDPEVWSGGRGKDVVFVVVDKPANPRLGTINVVFLTLQFCKSHLEYLEPTRIDRSILSDGREFFPVVELWFDPDEHIHLTTQPRKFAGSLPIVSIGSDERYSLPDVRFPSDPAYGDCSNWRWLSQTAPEPGETARWFANLQTTLQRRQDQRTAFHGKEDNFAKFGHWSPKSKWMR